MPFPVSSLPSRAPRVRTTEYTPAVLRFPSGDTVTGRLEVFSATGGLLCLPKPLIRGTRIRVMFLTPKGPVLGAAEMLTPVSWNQQAFRFVTPGPRGSTQTASHQRALPETGQPGSAARHSDTRPRTAVDRQIPGCGQPQPATPAAAGKNAGSTKAGLQIEPRSERAGFQPYSSDTLVAQPFQFL